MKAGDFLIATPTIIGDYNFRRSGILMVDRKTTGTVGFIINKKLEYTLDELMENVSSPFPMYYGGPVEQDNLFFVHKLGDQIPNSLHIIGDLHWSGDFETVLKLLDLKKVNASPAYILLGQASATRLIASVAPFVNIIDELSFIPMNSATLFLVPSKALVAFSPNSYTLRCTLP